ncbi:MAG: sigma-70 family RNA polymerase sigma factor, partial [Niabella sp.]|nr:sigma-70 family RNA polymerase sigma factor [Niabella sp.]
MQSPDLLFNEIKNGSREAFERLFREYYAPLVRFVFWQTGQRETAEDIVAAFFAKLWQKRALLDPVQVPGAYLYSAVKNAVIDYRRALQNKLNAIEPDDRSAAAVTAPVGETVENKELMELLERATETLPLKRKLIFRLVKEEGLQCSEVAQMLS